MLGIDAIQRHDMNDWVPMLALAVLGAGLVLYGVWKIIAANATASWPTTTATILASEVTKFPAANTYYWVADLVYRYAVAGTTYRSSRYSAAGNPAFFLRRTAQRIVEQHRPGTHAVVAYPRSDPSQGLLAPGAQPVLIAALRIIAIGLAMVCFAWKFYRGA
jgi:hypothetical protein